MLDSQRRVMSELGLDLETSYIWGMLVQYNLAAVIPHGCDPRVIDFGDVNLKQAFKPARLTDIAEVCRFPIETVRRKLNLLAEKGYVEQLPDKSWIVCSIDRLTNQFVTDGITRLLETARHIQGVLDRVKA
jgi:hypothetical protein